MLCDGGLELGFAVVGGSLVGSELVACLAEVGLGLLEVGLRGLEVLDRVSQLGAAALELLLVLADHLVQVDLVLALYGLDLLLVPSQLLLHHLVMLARVLLDLEHELVLLLLGLLAQVVQVGDLLAVPGHRGLQLRHLVALLRQHVLELPVRLAHCLVLAALPSRALLALLAHLCHL